VENSIGPRNREAKDGTVLNSEREWTECRKKSGKMTQNKQTIQGELLTGCGQNLEYINTYIDTETTERTV